MIESYFVVETRSVSALHIQKNIYNDNLDRITELVGVIYMKCGMERRILTYYLTL
jgi:hypothetical protein